MGVGHVPQDPIRAEGEGADVQGRQRRRAPTTRARPVTKSSAAAAKTVAARERGRSGEDAAALWYVERGYALVARNWRCASGEIDLIVRGSNVVVFCEVKSRASAEFGGPEGAVGWQKQRRLRRLAALWLSQSRPTGRFAIRFDVAAVIDTHVTVIEAAF